MTLLIHHRLDNDASSTLCALRREHASHAIFSDLAAGESPRTTSSSLIRCFASKFRLVCPVCVHAHTGRARTSWLPTWCAVPVEGGGRGEGLACSAGRAVVKL